MRPCQRKRGLVLVDMLISYEFEGKMFDAVNIVDIENLDNAFPRCFVIFSS